MPQHEPIILWMPINDEVIAELIIVDEEQEPELTEAILAYKELLEEEGVEIFQAYKTFLVCEDCVYLAEFDDMIEDETRQYFKT